MSETEMSETASTRVEISSARGETAESEIEHAIVDKGLDAPRLTPTDIDAAIVAEQYYRFPSTTVTVCCLTLRNGYSVIGASAAVSAENFDEQIGRDVARADARDHIWSLEGYRLKQTLHEQQQQHSEREHMPSTRADAPHS